MTAVTTALVTAASYGAPRDFAATAVGAVFLGATHLEVLRKEPSIAARYGLSLAGLFESAPLSASRVLRALSSSALTALGWLAVVTVPFAIGFKGWFAPDAVFNLGRALPSADEALSQILVIALPEEAFFRGYVQTELDLSFPKSVRILGLPIGLGVVLTSALFAIGHVLTVLEPSRLMVFFPSLLFGALRKKHGSIGPSVLFHAGCNLLSAALSRGFSG